MARQFPYAEHQETTGCTYLQKDEIYEDLSRQMENAVTMAAMFENRNGIGDFSQVQQFLVNAFGGSTSDYPYYKRGPNQYLLMLPLEMEKSIVVNRGTAWGQGTNWEFYYWNEEEESHSLTNHFRVRLNILNFPIKFWHPKFINQVVAEFGEVETIDEENIIGPDRSSLNLWIVCADPGRIPASKVLPFGDRWTQCYINIVGWRYIGWIPLEARLVENDGQGRVVHLDGDFKHARETLRLAHDRIRFYLAGRSPTSSPTSEAIPDNGQVHRSMHTPGSHHVQPAVYRNRVHGEMPTVH